MRKSDWHNLYGESWTGIITSESFAHPAKFSRGLIRHIYQHLFDEGWLQPGDTVLDPFGGVALGALHAMQRGLAWVGVELEQKFVDLGQQNIDLWNERFGPHLPNWGSAVLLQGDSRQLSQVVGEAGGLISSPPYAGTSVEKNSDGIDLTKQYQTYRASGGAQSWEAFQRTQRLHSQGYSTNPANLGNMPAGDPSDGHGVDAVIGSPPYAQALSGKTNQDTGDRNHVIARGRNPDSPGQGYPRFYGQTPGQLAAMPPGPGPGQVADGLVSSPPHGHSCSYQQPGSGGEWWELMRQGHSVQEIAKMRKRGDKRVLATKQQAGYSRNMENLGNQTNTTFWSAARLILQQCYQVLKSGAPAVWVVKSFVRKGQRVDFPGQWRQLCESCGFETVHEHRAWLVEDRGAQHDIFGNLHERKVERKSFFRRLAERNARADKLWPTVSRDDQAAYLWQAHGQLWRQYHRRVAGDLLPSELPDDEPSPPTRSGILRNAKTIAYVEAGSPDIEVATQIDYEVVLCTVKR